MKKIPFASLIVLFFLLTIQIGYGQLQLGIKGGFNLTHFNIGIENLRINQFNAGYNAGVFAKLNIFGFLALQPELLYNTKGHSSEYFDYHLNYIELPVYLVLNITNTVNLHFGPYASILSDGQITSIIPGFRENITINSFKFFDYGFSAGTSADFKRFSLGLRHNWGVVPIIDDYRLAGKLYNIAEAKNSVWQIFLAINLIKIGKS
ncbi:MAG: PorT family protein [Bacteroidetes bacterium]|nr:PorT family protein [Bacteroidota bacterium]HET6244319.1 porin family protein [Bacteroidia bacterium]